MKATHLCGFFEWNKIASVNIAHKTYGSGELTEKLVAK